MQNDTQIVKGLLEGCILKIAQNEEIYGYQVIDKLNSCGFSVNEATVYPILTRLQKKGFLKAEMRPSVSGPHRKYYYLTIAGLENLYQFEQQWLRIRSIVDKIMEVD